MTSIPGLSSRTVVQMPIPRRQAELYLGNTVVPGLLVPFHLWGLCSPMAELARAASGAEARELHGLGEPTRDFPFGDGLFVLRFNASWPGLFHTAFGGQSPEGAARFGSTLVLPEPFQGTGFTKYAPAAVPEYWMELSEVPIAAELWHLAESGGDGCEVQLAAYAGRHSGWRVLPAGEARGLTPGAAAGVPAGSIGRGLLVGFQGTGFPADFGPEPGQVTAYRTAEDGEVMARVLAEDQCDELEYFRLRCTWRESEFEILAIGEETATLSLLTGNSDEAARLGLQSAGRHAWRAQAPKDELQDLAEETRKLAELPEQQA